MKNEKRNVRLKIHLSERKKKECGEKGKTRMGSFKWEKKRIHGKWVVIYVEFTIMPLCIPIEVSLRFQIWLHAIGKSETKKSNDR